MSEEGKLVTQTADEVSLTHTGEELTEGRHYWEVEIATYAKPSESENESESESDLAI